MKKLLTITGAIGLVAVILALGLAALPTGAADHRDAPGVNDDGRTDINDIYAFQSPSNPNNTVLIMTVNPAAGTTIFQSSTTFRDNSNYEFMIGNGANPKTRLQYEIRFGRPDGNGIQNVRLRVRKIGEKFKTIAEGRTRENVPVDGGGMLRADIFDDPFFFDLLAFQDNLNFCPGGKGQDFFAGLNVTAIVLEVPSSSFETNNIGVWARTRVGGPTVDRMGRPAINTVFIPSAKKDDFNQTAPVRDREKFTGDVVNTLLALGNDQATAEALAAVLLPDILTLDTSSSAGFLNGRKLADDVIDAELSLISGGAITTDCVDSNDAAFSNTFPYLAPPHS